MTVVSVSQLRPWDEHDDGVTTVVFFIRHHTPHLQQYNKFYADLKAGFQYDPYIYNYVEILCMYMSKPKQV